MPNLKALLERGASGPLRSTIPPVTAPAWTSFTTGVNPGKHSLITWQRRVSPNMTDKRWVSSQDVRAPRLWDWLPELTVGILNLPVSYPPMKVNGFAVSGMLTPNSSKSYTYPQELKPFIERVSDGYILDVDLINSDWDLVTEKGQLAFLDTVRVACRKRVQVALALEDRYRPDLYIIVFETPDRIQHVLWCYAIQDDFPGKSEAVQQAVLDCYRELDVALGMLLDKLHDHNVLLISDHGFCHQHTLVYTNGWLAEQGLLTYRSGALAVRGPVRQAFRALKRQLPHWLKRRGRLAFSADSLVDWDHTQAYTGFPMDHGFYVNLRGREPFGTVEPGNAYETLRRQLRDGLLKLQDTSTGEHIFQAIYLREEIYEGPYVDMAPDIVFELTPGYKVSSTPSEKLLLEDVGQAGEGFHQQNGVLLLAGHGIAPGKQIIDAAIIDIAPSIMHMLGAAVPRYMDGRILTEAFCTEYSHEHPAHYTDAAAPEGYQGTEKPAYDEQDQTLIEKRLQGLGYL